MKQSYEIHYTIYIIENDSLIGMQVLDDDGFHLISKISYNLTSIANNNNENDNNNNNNNEVEILIFKNSVKAFSN